MVHCQVKRYQPEELREEQEHIPSTMVSCTKEVSRVCSSAVSNQVKAKRYSEIFIRENVGTMHHREH